MILHERFRQHRRKIGIAGIVLLLAVLIGIGGFIIYKSTHKKQQPVDNTVKSLQDTTVHVEDLKYAGAGDQAVAAAQRALDSATDAKSKAYYNLQLGTLYESKKDYKKAMTYYRAAEAYHVTEVHTESGIARCSEALGDKETAIKYYKIAYNNVDRSRMGYDAKLSTFEAKIKALGGTL